MKSLSGCTTTCAMYAPLPLSQLTLSGLPLSVFGQNERSEALMPSYLWITYGLFCRDRLTCTRAKPCSIARIGHLHADAVAAHRKLRFPCALSIVEKGYRHVSTLISPVA